MALSGQARAIIEAPPQRRVGPRRPAAPDDRAPGPVGPLGWQELRQRRYATQPDERASSGQATRLTLVLVALYALALWQNSIWYRRAWSTTIKSTFDGLVYALVTAGTFGWLWPR